MFDLQPDVSGSPANTPVRPLALHSNRGKSIATKVPRADWLRPSGTRILREPVAVILLALSIQAGLVTSAPAVTPFVVAGAANGFAIDKDGMLSGWGNDSAGQLGIGRKLQSPLPFQVGDGFTTLSARSHQVFAFKADGTLWGWGANTSGQLGDGTTAPRSRPVQITGGFNIVSAGDFHTVALKPDGSLWAWGANESGQLGDATYADSATPKKIDTGYQSIVAAWRHTVALRTDGTLWAWGYNAGGQLGDGTTTFRNTPVQIGSGFSAIAGGDSHTVALQPDGSLWAWGSNKVGQLGDGTTNSSLVPKKIGMSYANISAIKNATMALKTDGTLWAWGNAPGPISSYSPTMLGSGFTAFSIGRYHAVALKSDGSLWAWGSNAFGQLGDGTINSDGIPVRIGSGFVAIAAGDYHTAAIKTDGSLWTWGSDSLGQLGDGILLTEVSHPVSIGTSYASIAVGGGNTQYVSDTHVVALKADGSLWAWGNNSYGQFGDRTEVPSSVPKLIGQGYSAIAAGLFFTIALKTDGTLWGWGTNLYGQLGNQNTNTRFLPPVQIGSGYRTVSAGGDAGGYVVALKTDSTAWSWGFNASGQLGDGTTVDRSTPQQIGSSFSAIATGNSHTVALKTDGTLWAWGDNSAGQLGDGTNINSPIPRQIGAGYRAVAAGLQFTAAIKDDGTLWAWGRNDYGQLGNGSTINSSTPKQVGIGYSVVATGQSQVIAIKSDGSVVAWGRNGSGQLGDGTFVQHLSPALVINPGLNGFLNLNSSAAFEPPPGLGIPFFVATSGGISDTSASVSTITKFNSAGADKQGAVFVTAMVPDGTLGAAPGAVTERSVMRAVAPDTTASSGFILIQLTPLGWQPVVNGQLVPFASGVLDDRLAAQTILNGTDTTKLKGAEFCVGYGLTAADMIAAGTMRAVATIPDANPSSTAVPTCIVRGPAVSFNMEVLPNWSLLGNSLNQTVPVTSLYGDASAINTVWKWDAATLGWQFYTPTLNAAALETFAASKGYAVLSEIKPGEGYWVNAKTQHSLGTQSGGSFVTTSANLAKGWNLAATGIDITPSIFNTNVKSSLPGTGVTSLWAWDALEAKWYFYAPSLDAQGGSTLADYITNHGYLDFYQSSKTLGKGAGFWVNRP